MKEIIKYQAKDNSLFDTKDECINYEKFIDDIECTLKTKLSNKDNLYIDFLIKLRNYTTNTIKQGPYMVLDKINNCEDKYVQYGIASTHFYLSFKQLREATSIVFDKENYIYNVITTLMNSILLNIRNEK